MRLFHVAVLALAFLLAELVRAKTILENGVAQNEVPPSSLEPDPRPERRSDVICASRQAEPVDTAQGAPLPFPEGAQRSQVLAIACMHMPFSSSADIGCHAQAKSRTHERAHRCTSKSRFSR